MDQNERQQQYAYRILETDRRSLVMKHPFLARAFYALEGCPGADPYGAQGTDGVRYYYAPARLVRDYLDDEKDTQAVFLHSVLHCLYLHPFFAEKYGHESAWDIACDISIWEIMIKLDPELHNQQRNTERQTVLDELRTQIKILSAQNIYRYLVKQTVISGDQDCNNHLRQLFALDDHRYWKRQDAENNAVQERPAPGTQERPAPGAQERSEPGAQEGSKEDSGKEARDRLEEKQWADIADHVEVSLEIEMHAHRNERGDQTADLLRSLKEIEREHLDYREFLTKFAAMEERMLIDLDTFDYTYYTYGLELYGDMPLIEPLEYKETHSIRDFVIAIDTSGSCDAALLHKFLTKTYDILSEARIFDQEMNVHILQCDAAVKEDVVIHNGKELDAYIQNMRIRGGGGTDFRPVFERVEELRRQGDLTHIRGLLYFTDGEGVFPETPTDYKTAFVFAQTQVQVPVPSWAIKVNIEEEGL